jgi:hypothetical protein
VQNPTLQAGSTIVVLLGLYAFYCHWEANRAELASAFRRRTRGGPGESGAEAPRYRARCRWSLLACTALAASALATSL